MDKFNSPVYKRSRNSYLVYCAFEYFALLLISDAFLAKLLSSIGISDSLVGIISSFVSLACLFQLITIFVLRLKTNFKALSMTLEFTSILFFMTLYLIPFMPFGKTTKTVMVMVCFFMGYLLKYTVSVLIFRWGNSFVHPAKRASYSSAKEVFSLFTGILVTAVAGYVMDKFELANNLSGSFLVFSGAILFFDICLFVCLMLIKKEEPSQQMASDEPFKVVFKNLAKNKNLRSLILLSIIWESARFFSIGFLGTFKTKDLMLSVFAVQVINISASIARMLVSVPFGRYSDKHTMAKGLKLGIAIAGLSFLMITFTTKSSWYLIIAHTILLNCGYAGTGQNSTNIIYSYVDVKYISQAMAIKSCIGGVCGFLASLLGGKVLDIIQANSNTIFGIHVYGQQVLSAVSFMLCVIAIIYIRKVIEKEKVMVQ